MIACCITLDNCINDVRVPLDYNVRFNRYQIPLSSSSSFQILSFCPFCSDELPDYTDAYYDNLEAMFGKKVDFSTLVVPEEFLSGKWWQNDS